jgi:hypothetical protein
MTVRFQCTCGKKLKAPDEHAGKRMLCAGCGNPVRVPMPDDDLDEEEDDVPRKSGTAAAIAHELVARRESEKKKERESEYELASTGEPATDYVALSQEVARAVLPGVALIVVICTVTYWLSTSVMSSDRGLPELGEVSGQVTLDGQPLADAAVTFQPVAGEEAGSKVSASVGRTDADGNYELNYVKDIQGAAVGAHRVMIQAPLPTGQEQLPPRYNLSTELTADVQSGGNTFDFPLTSKQ